MEDVKNFLSGNQDCIAFPGLDQFENFASGQFEQKYFMKPGFKFPLQQFIGHVVRNRGIGKIGSNNKPQLVGTFFPV